MHKRMSHILTHWRLGCLYLFLSVLLSACSSMHRDGPPPYYVDETRIPNAVPKIEPLSRLGNMHSYVVSGRRYYVMRSAKDYEERGIASWYGTQFHHHHTSSGERYNMLAMTAAHKTLPLPTYVEVTNLHNQRKVIVKVNDRGPFENNRLIDLSYVAAKKLGMLGRGTAEVDVRAIDPRQSPTEDTWIVTKSQTASTKKSGALQGLSPMYIRVATLKQKSTALQVLYKVHLLTNHPVRIHHANHRYYVQIGPLRDFKAIDQLSRRLHESGLHSDLIG